MRSKSVFVWAGFGFLVYSERLPPKLTYTTNKRNINVIRKQSFRLHCYLKEKFLQFPTEFWIY